MSLFSQDRDLVGYGGQPPVVAWPGDARVAVSLAIAYEEGSERSRAAGDPEGETLGESAFPKSPGYRDFSMESVYQYGSRAGVWRLLRVLEDAGVPATFFASAAALKLNAPLAQTLRDGQHEVAGHGWRWQEPTGLTEDEEREQIAATVATIEELIGSRPRGWISRTVRSRNTRRLLVEEGGFVYDSDDFDDDLPYEVEVAGKAHLVLPYTMVLNDARYVIPQGFTSPAAFLDFATRTFEQLWREGADAPRMMTIGMHPRWSGHPGRASAIAEFIDHLQQHGGAWLATRLQIAEHWRSETRHSP